jgi:hypothetical protein
MRLPFGLRFPLAMAAMRGLQRGYGGLEEGHAYKCLERGCGR